jgi:hypothetical protein
MQNGSPDFHRAQARGDRAGEPDSGPDLSSQKEFALERSSLLGGDKNEEVTAADVGKFYGSGPGAFPALLMTLGLVAAPAVYTVRETDAHVRVQPLRTATRDLNFRALYGQAISNAIPTNCWLKPVRFDVINAAAKTATPKELSHEAVLNIETRYQLSDDFDSLVTASTLSFYLPGTSNVIAATNGFIYSAGNFAATKRKEAMGLWTTNHAAAFRQAVTDSVEENARLIRSALEEMGGAMPEQHSLPTVIETNYPGLENKFGRTQ